MALNASGPISIAGTTAGESIQIELNGNGTTTMSLNDASVRTLAGPAFTTPATTIQMPTNFYGKSNRATLSVTYSTNTTNATVAIGSLPGYIAGTSDITITINSGVYVYSTSVSNSGLTITGGTAGDTLNIVNNGFILGQGGFGAGTNTGFQAQAGGPALSLSYPATINNTNPAAFVAGGGGGGGLSSGSAGGGGGAGGAAGGNGPGGTGGAGGGVGSAGANSPSSGGFGGGSGGGGGALFSTPKSTTAFGGGGGGRILPGTGGAAGGSGGAGGSANANGNPGPSGGGGGGGWGASGGSGPFSGGQAGGRAVTLNGNSVTWTSGNTTRVYGAVS